MSTRSPGAPDGTCSRARGRCREDEPYGNGKRACEQALHERAGSARGLPFTVIRPPVVMGPDDPSGRVWFYAQRITDGRRVLLPSGFPTSATCH